MKDDDWFLANGDPWPEGVTNDLPGRRTVKLPINWLIAMAILAVACLGFALLKTFGLP